MLERFRDFSFERTLKLNRAGDVVLLAAAAGVAATGNARTWQVALALFVQATIFWLIAYRALGQYDERSGRGFAGDAALTLVMAIAVVTPMLVLSAALPRFATSAHVSRFAIVFLPTLVALRMRLVGLTLLKARPVGDVLIAGIGALGRITGGEIGEGGQRRRLLGYLRFDDEAPHTRLRGPLIGMVNELETTLKTRVVDEVYFASSAKEHSVEIQAAIRTCEKFGVPFALPVCAYRLTRAKPTAVTPQGDGYAHFLTVQIKPLQWSLKRLFDIVCSGSALVLLSPLLLFVALAIKLTSRGDVLFCQERVGLLGRRFGMFKFRSMVSNAEELKAKLMASNEQSGPVFKMKKDPRVTGIGRFIRKYSIDELPQIVNVLRGDMSIVGPRPPIPSEVDKYEAWQRRRLSVRPGLTCVWQVSGRNEISFTDWMLLDMRYIDHWSLGQDFALILKTVPVVLTGRGAS